MDSGGSCPCDSSDLSSDPTEYLDALKRKYLDRTAKLQVQQIELEQRIRHMENFLGADKQDEDDSMSTCSCDIQTVPKIFPETPVRDNYPKIIAPITAQPPSQPCSFFQKIMDNARSILSIKCQCPSTLASAKSTSVTPQEETTHDFTPTDPPTRENDTPNTQNLPDTETAGFTDSDSKTSICTCDHSNSTLLEASCSCNLGKKVPQAQQVSLTGSKSTPTKSQDDSATDTKNTRSLPENSEKKDCPNALDVKENCSCEACRCSSSIVDDKRLQIEADQPVVIPKITVFSSKVNDNNPIAEVQATASVQSKGLTTQFARDTASKCVTCCQLKSCPSKKLRKDTGENTTPEIRDKPITQNKSVNSSIPKIPSRAAACCQSTSCPSKTRQECPVQSQCIANASAARGGGRPDGPPGAFAVREGAGRGARGLPDDYNPRRSGVPVRMDQSFVICDCEYCIENESGEGAGRGARGLPDNSNPPSFEVPVRMDRSSVICDCVSYTQKDKATDYKPSGLIGPKFDACFEKCETTRQDGQNQCAFVGSPLLNPSDFRIAKPLEDRSAGNSVPCSEGPPNICQNRQTFSLTSNDIQEMQNIAELAKKEKQMKAQIEALQKRERAYQEVSKDMNTLVNNTAACCNCHSANNSPNMQNEIQKISQELRLENQILKTELMDLKIEMKHCLEKVEGPMTQKLQTEKHKCEVLQQKLQSASQNMLLSQDTYAREMNQLKLQLCCACANITELNQMNGRLKEEMSQLDCLCAKLEDDLVKQKINEADTIKRLTNRRLSGDGLHNRQSIDETRCDSSLDVIARKLSKTLKELAPCDECTTVPPELAGAAKCIKELTDMVRKRRMGSSTSGGCCCESKSKYSAKNTLGDECCTCCCESLERVDNKDTSKTRVKKSSPAPAGAYPATSNAVPKSTAREVSRGEKCDCPTRTANYGGGEPNDAISHQTDQKMLQTLLPIPESFVQKDGSSKFDVDVAAASFYSAQDNSPDDFVLATADVEKPTLDSKGTTTKEDNVPGTEMMKANCRAPCSKVKLAKSDVMTETPPMKVDKACKAPCSRTGIKAGKDTEGEAQPGVEAHVMTDSMSASMKAGEDGEVEPELGVEGKTSKGATDEVTKVASERLRDIFDDLPSDDVAKFIDGHLPLSSINNNFGEAGSKRVARGITFNDAGALGSMDEVTQEASKSIPQMSEDVTGLTTETPTDERTENKPSDESERDTLKDNLVAEDTEKTETGDDKEGLAQFMQQIQSSTGRIAGQEISFEEVRIGTFPVDVQTKAYAMDEAPDGLHVTTTVTSSGNLDIITDGPGGTIATTLTYTDEGNIEVVTEMVEYSDQKPSPAEQALEKYKTEPTISAPGVPKESYNLLEENADHTSGEDISSTDKPKLKPLFPVSSSKFSGPSGPETDTPYTPSSVSGEGELTSNLGSKSSGVKDYVNMTPDLTSGGASTIKDTIITPEGFVMIGPGTTADGGMTMALSGTESASRAVELKGFDMVDPGTTADGGMMKALSSTQYASRALDSNGVVIADPGTTADGGMTMAVSGTKSALRALELKGFDMVDPGTTADGGLTKALSSTQSASRAVESNGLVMVDPGTTADGGMAMGVSGTKSALRALELKGATQSAQDAIRQEVEGHTDPVSSEAGITSTGVEMPSGEVFTPDQVGSDAEVGSSKPDEAGPKEGVGGITLSTAKVTRALGEESASSLEVVDTERTLDGESPGTVPAGPRKTRDCSCQSKDQKDQSCQCCECKTIGVTTSGDKETITAEQEAMCKTPEEEPRTDTDSEFVTTSDFTENAARQPPDEKTSGTMSKDPELTKDNQLLQGSNVIIDQNMIEKHPELAGKSPSQQQQILETIGYVTPKMSTLIDQSMLEKHPELVGKTPSQQQRILENIGYVTPKVSTLIDQDVLDKHPELAGKTPSQQQQILENIGYVTPKVSMLIDQSVLDEHPELAGKTPSQQRQILENMGYVTPKVSTLIDQNVLEKHPELAGKTPSQQQQILESIGYVTPKVSTIIDQNVLEKHPELAGKTPSQQQQIFENIGYVTPKVSTLIDQSVLDKHPELVGKTPSQQQQILENIGYVNPKMSTLIDQNVLAKHPELAGKTPSQQQQILENIGYVTPQMSTLIDQNVLDKHPELAGKSPSQQELILKNIGYVVPKASTLIDQSMLEKHPELAGKTPSQQQQILKNIGYVVPKASTLIDQSMLEKHPEFAGKTPSQQQQILKNIGYVVPKASTLIDQSMLEKHPELAGKTPSQQQQILKNIGYVVPKASTLIDQSMLEKHPELAGKTPSQQQQILENTGYVVPKTSTLIDQSILEKHPELAGKTPSQQQQILENIGYVVPKTSTLIDQSMIEKHPELEGKTPSQQQQILENIGYVIPKTSTLIDQSMLEKHPELAGKTPSQQQQILENIGYVISTLIDQSMLEKHPEPAGKTDEQQKKILTELPIAFQEKDSVSKSDKSKPSSKEVSITCRAPCRSATTIHDNVAKFSGNKTNRGDVTRADSRSISLQKTPSSRDESSLYKANDNKITRGDVARADSRSISLQKTPSSRDGSSLCKAKCKTVSVQRNDEVAQADRNNSSTLTSSSTSNEKIKRKEKIKSKPGEVPSMVSELSDKDRPVIEAPKKSRVQRKKRSARIMDCLKCNCEDPCKCEVCSPDKSGRRQRKVSRPVRSCDCPSPVLMHPMPMASSMPLPSNAGTCTFNPFTCYPQLTPGTMVRGESGTSDDNDAKKIKRHSSKCECVDCLCMPKIRMLAETREYPVVYDQKQVYHVKTTCDTCSDAQKAKKNTEQRSRIPISTSTPNPPRPGVVKPSNVLPGDDVVSHSDSIYNSIACDCPDCKCVECPDPNAKSKLQKSGRSLGEKPDGKSDKNCCCQETCTCVPCTMEELLKKLNEAEKKLADAQRASPVLSPPQPSPPEKSPNSPSDQKINNAGDDEDCTCLECTTCPYPDLMNKKIDENPAETVRDHPETGDEEECTCPECVCPGAPKPPERQVKPDSTSPLPSDKNKPTKPDGHPADCDCADCSCPGIDGFTKTGGEKTPTLPNMDSSPEEKTGGGDDDCNCKICECPGKTSLVPNLKAGEKQCDCEKCICCDTCDDEKKETPISRGKGEKEIDRKAGERAIPECDCNNCLCSPCADPKKKLELAKLNAVEKEVDTSDNLLAECDCVDCKCNPCADPKKGKGKQTAKGAGDLGTKSVSPVDGKASHLSNCDCDECECLKGIEDKNGGIHPPDCDCPECHCPGPTDQATPPSDGKGGIHPPECDCPECHCPGLTDQATPPTVGKDGIHPPDCDCPECHSKGVQGQATQPSTDKPVHPADCDCSECKCLDIVDQAVHALGCACAECLCVECPKKAAHAPGCQCDACICQTCDYQDKEKPAPATITNDHTDACSCIKCVCNLCVEPSKQSEKPIEASQVPARTGQGEHGDGCKCVGCLCKECLLKLEPLKHEEGCLCVQCACVDCLRQMSRGGTVQPRSLGADEQFEPGGDEALEPGKGDNCTCEHCLCIDCSGKSATHRVEGVVGRAVGQADGQAVESCTCAICQCEPCPQKESDEPCRCPECTCIDCTKKKGIPGTGVKKTHGNDDDTHSPGTGDKKTHGNDKDTHSPICDCSVCQCPDETEPGKVTVAPSTNVNDKETHSPVCECPECKCPDTQTTLTEPKVGSGDDCDCVPVCKCEEPGGAPDIVKTDDKSGEKPGKAPDTVKIGDKGDECDCVPVCKCEEPGGAPDNVKIGDQSGEKPVSVPDNVKIDGESGECDCGPACKCDEPQTASKPPGLPEGETKKPAGGDGGAINLTDPPPFQVPKRIDCDCNNCDCIICIAISGGKAKIRKGARGLGGDDDDDDAEPPPFEIPVRIDCNCDRCDCIYCNKDGPLTKEASVQQSKASRIGPRALVEASAQPSKTGPDGSRLIGASGQPSKTGPNTPAIKSKQSGLHHKDCKCLECQCVICSPVLPQKASELPGAAHGNAASNPDVPIHCACPTCTCNEGEIKTTTFTSGAPSAAATAPSSEFKMANDNDMSADTVELPKPTLDAHMVKVHPVACDCPQCKCEPCADPNPKKSARSMGNKASVKQMDNLALAKSIQAANKENCECKSQIEEIKRTLERIKCACLEAEFKSTQSMAQTMGRSMDNPSDKPFVKQASPFGQTMSGLKMALANLQAKCKAKDRMIAAMTGELEIRGDPTVFDKVLDKTNAPTNPLDYDQAEDVKSIDRSQLVTNVIYGRSLAEQGTGPDSARNVASKCVEVRTHRHKKKKGKESARNMNTDDVDCACSKPQIIQKEEKDCQKLDLVGFEVIDIRRITDDSLIVKWNVPKCNEVNGYDIFVNGTLASKVMSGSRTSAMMHSLDLSKSVQITIYAVSKCGRIEPPAIAIYEIKS